MKYLKRLKKDEITLGIIFVILSVSAVVFLRWKGLIYIPILLGLVIIYLNIDGIFKLIKKLIRRIKNRKTIKTPSKTNNSTINDDSIIRIKNKKEGDNMKKNNSKKKPISKKKKKTKRKWWKKILTIILIGGIVVIISIAALLIYIISSAGTFDPDALANQDQTVVYDSSGSVIATLGREKRESVTYDDLPQVLIDALIATEDSRFFQHNGVDIARFIKASFGQLTGNDYAGGASTLTMQVVKNNLTSTEKSIIRKLKDIYLSVFFVEKKYTKEEIIEFYINDSLLGGNIYGVEEASKYYFGKSVSELSLPEASLIIGLFQSPNGYNPYNYPEEATKRRATVLNLMVRHGYITQDEADFANSVSVESLLVGTTEKDGYQGFIDTVVEEVIAKTENDPYLVSMKIYTTMRKDIQDGINSVLSGESYKGWENDVVQAAIAVTDVNNGAIVAIGAGRNREGERTYNYATMAKRQPGSTAKPLFDYGPGFEFNNFSTYTLFNDEKWTYTNGPEVGNWDGGYFGLITLRTALAFSRNIPALKAFQQVSKKNILKFVQGLGLDPALEDGALHEAYAIGGGSGFTPLELAVAYSAFANGGYHIDPYCVTKIEYRSTGKIEEFKYQKERVMADSTSYLVNNVLKYAVDSGFNGGARVPGSVVAAKTGTSNIDGDTAKRLSIPTSAVVDLWTIAYTPEHSVALWYGYEELTAEHYLTGASAPKDSLMAAVMKYIPKSTTNWSMPATVVASNVEFGSWPAQMPSQYTPKDFILTEYFIKGTQPTEVSDRFAKLDDVTNLTATKSSEGITLSWDFETPKVLKESYLEDYFSQSIFGNGSQALLEERLNYNEKTLGDIGFRIYTENSDDTLTPLAFTTDNEYTYYASGFEGDRTITLLIKTEYENYQANASDGVTRDISITGTGYKLSLDIGSVTITPKVGNYVHEPETVTYDGNDITGDVTITYKLTNSSLTVNSTYTNSTTLKNTINNLPAGIYSLKYTVTYKGETISKIKTITIHN